VLEYDNTVFAQWDFPLRYKNKRYVPPIKFVENQNNLGNTSLFFPGRRVRAHLRKVESHHRSQIFSRMQELLVFLVAYYLGGSVFVVAD
jgi:hypothetical protein